MTALMMAAGRPGATALALPSARRDPAAILVPNATLISNSSFDWSAAAR